MWNIIQNIGENLKSLDYNELKDYFLQVLLEWRDRDILISLSDKWVFQNWTD